MRISKFSRKVLGFTLLEGLLLLLIVSALAGGIVFFILNDNNFNYITNETKDPHSENVFNYLSLSPVRHGQIIINLDDTVPFQTATIENKILFPFNKQKKIATEWPLGNAGFLVKSYDGIHKELVDYRYQTTKKVSATSAYNALLDLDVNKTQRIDSANANYAYLYVWFDTNQNGNLNEGELVSLKDLGINAIVIDSMEEVNQPVNQSVIIKKGHFTRENGSKGSILEVDLFQDPYYRQFLRPIALSEASENIPNIAGSGDVRDLQEAVTQNPKLLSIVTEYFTLGSVDQQYNMMDDVLFEWASSADNTFLTSLKANSTSRFKIELDKDLKSNQYDDASTDTERVFSSLMVVERFTGKKQLDLFTREILNSTTGEKELHLAISLDDQIIMRRVITGNTDGTQKKVLIAEEMLNLTPEQRIVINQQYDDIKKTYFDQFQKAIKSRKQIVTQTDEQKSQWVDTSLQQQINTGEYFKKQQKKQQPIDYPRRRHLYECVKSGNIIDEQVRDCAAGKISKTW